MKNAIINASDTNATRGKKALVVAAALSMVLTGSIVLTAKRAKALDSPPATTQQAAWDWTTVGSAAEAARAAGLSQLGLPSTVVIRDLSYENPTYSTAGGVAQATYETPATALVVRKGAVGGHTAPLTDRTEAELPHRDQLDVDGLYPTILGLSNGEATVITWVDGNVEYGITWQGLGGEEMAMSTDDAARLVRIIRDTNAEAQPQQPTQNQTTHQQPTQQQTSQAQNLISSQEAINIATSYVAGGNNASNVSCELSSESTEPRYVVTFHYDDADYLVKVGAHDGSVWYATAIYNDGTTHDATKRDDKDTLDGQDTNLEGENTEQSDSQQSADKDSDGVEQSEGQQQGQRDTATDQNVEVNVEA